ncbi:hypothetical protein BJ742DRAFT_815973 [Cladochytrium replicatum]|nr:hypothetical protein BJ742DRAFT_815973 [Cladochytrium replicatum]
MKAKTKHRKRKEQSQHDRTENYWKKGQLLSDPLGEYRLFLANLRLYGFSPSDYLRIPINLIDLTATLITSLITGRDLVIDPSTLELASPLQDLPQNSLNHTADNENIEAFSFIRRMIRRTRLSCSTFILGLLYVVRARMQTKKARRRAADVRKRESTIETFLASVICADKILYDSTYTNKDWSEFTEGRFSLRDINEMERHFLQKLDFNLFVTDVQFEEFLMYLDLTLFFRQMYRWSTLTYRDLLRLSLSVPSHQIAQYAGRGQNLNAREGVTLLFSALMRAVLSYVAAMAVVLGAVIVVQRYAFATGYKGIVGLIEAGGSRIVVGLRGSYLHAPGLINTTPEVRDIGDTLVHDNENTYTHDRRQSSCEYVSDGSAFCAGQLSSECGSKWVNLESTGLELCAAY